MLNNKILMLLACVAITNLSGCASHPPSPEPVPDKPTGEYQWTNKKLYSKKPSSQQINDQFDTDKAACTIEKHKIAMPATTSTCWQPPPTRIDSFGNITSPPRKCESNFMARLDASLAQKEVFESCLILRGWTKVFVPFQNGYKGG